MDPDAGVSVGVDSSGNLVLSGTFQGTIDLGDGLHLLSAGLTDAFVAAYDGSGVYRWSRSAASAGCETAGGVAISPAGTVYAAGMFQNAVDLGGGSLPSTGSYDTFLVSYAADGLHRWSRRVAGGGLELARGVDLAPGGAVVVGGSFRHTVSFDGSPLTSAGGDDLFLAGLAPDGQANWSRRAGAAAADATEALAIDGSGNVYVTGYFQGVIDLGGGSLTSAGNEDIFLASFTAQGDHRWSKSFGSPPHDAGYAVAVDAAGNVYLAGELQQSVDVGGGALTSAGGNDVLIASFTTTGAHRWSRAFGGTSADAGRGVAVDAGGRVFVTGTFTDAADLGGAPLTGAGNGDIFVASYASADGAHRWSQALGGDAHDAGRGIAVGGDVFVTGAFQETASIGGTVLTSAGAGDVFVASYSADGDARWSLGFGSSQMDEGIAVATDSDGNVFVTGYFQDAVDLGGGALESQGAADIFVASFTAAGVHRWSGSLGGDAGDRGTAIAVRDATVVVAGGLADVVDLGGSVLTGVARAGFVAAFAR